MKRQFEKGFTLIEMLVVAPIVILAIGAFLTVIISMTGEVISSRAANTLTYNIQDALNRIEEDVKLSSGFLAETDTNLTGAGGNALETGQGVNDTTAPFRNIASGSNALILNMIATNGNPLSATSAFIYLKDQPNACATPQANVPLSYNVVYFVEDSTLWRRVIMPTNYNDTTNTVCATPWQRPSCNPGFIVSPGNAFCATEDIRLVDNVTNFSTQYLNGASGDTPIAAALVEGTNSALNIAARNVALQSATTLSASISSTQTAAGREVTQASSIRVSRLDINASSIAVIPVATTPSAPAINGTTAPAAQAIFTWPSVSGATGYTFEYNINGGSWTTGFTNQNTRTFTVNAPYNGAVVNARVVAINSAGTSSQSLKTVTIPVWEPLILANGWLNYEAGYARAAYTKTSTGAVLLKGLVRKTSAMIANEQFATLPSGYRPTGLLLFGTSTDSNATGRIDIGAGGEVILNNGSAAWISLETIRFVAAGTYPITNGSPLNGWSAYAAPWQGPGHMQDSLSRVWVQGLLNIGTNADNTPIFNMPAGRQVDLYQHIASRSAGFASIGVSPTSVVTKGAGSSYLAVNAMYYPSGAGTWTNLTLQNSWVYYGASFSTPQYTKAADGIVSLKGLIRSGSTAFLSTITTLPVGHRPRETLLYTTVSQGAHARIDILPSGVVQFHTGSNGWYSLDGIHFLAEQ